MKILLYLEGLKIQKEAKNALTSTLYDAANLKAVQNLIFSELFSSVHRIEPQKFDAIEPLVRKVFRDLSQIMAIVLIEGTSIKVHWRDDALYKDAAAMQKLRNKLYSPNYRHHLGFSMTVQD